MENITELTEENITELTEENITELTEENITKLCEFIKTKRGKMTDEVLAKMVEDQFSYLSMNFENCTQIDKRIYGKSGGYWRAAYDYPNDGDEVDVPTYDGEGETCIVENVGFFTMGVY